MRGKSLFVLLFLFMPLVMGYYIAPGDERDLNQQRYNPDPLTGKTPLAYDNVETELDFLNWVIPSYRNITLLSDGNITITPDKLNSTITIGIDQILIDDLNGGIDSWITPEDWDANAFRWWEQYTDGNAGSGADGICDKNKDCTIYGDLNITAEKSANVHDLNVNNDLNVGGKMAVGDGSPATGTAINSRQTYYTDSAAKFGVNQTLQFLGDSLTGFNPSAALGFALTDKRNAVNPPSFLDHDFLFGIYAALSKQGTYARQSTLQVANAVSMQVSDTGTYSIANPTWIIGFSNQLFTTLTGSTTINPTFSHNGTMTYNYVGSHVSQQIKGTYGGGNTDVNAIGYYVNLSYSPSSGDANNSRAYAFRTGGMTGFDDAWNIYNQSTAPNWLGGDNVKTYMGSGQDASIYYDNSPESLVLNPKETGNGNIVLAGDVNANEDLQIEGAVYGNSDGDLNIYANLGVEGDVILTDTTKTISTTSITSDGNISLNPDGSAVELGNDKKMCFGNTCESRIYYDTTRGAMVIEVD